MLTAAQPIHQQIPLPSEQISRATTSQHLHRHPRVQDYPPCWRLQDAPSWSSCFHPPPMYCLSHIGTRMIVPGHKCHHVIFLPKTHQRFPPTLGVSKKPCPGPRSGPGCAVDLISFPSPSAASRLHQSLHSLSPAPPRTPQHPCPRASAPRTPGLVSVPSPTCPWDGFLTPCRPVLKSGFLEKRFLVAFLRWHPPPWVLFPTLLPFRVLITTDCYGSARPLVFLSISFR